MDPQSASRLRQIILDALALRASHATFCPSELARLADPVHWRALMPWVREAARSLAREGAIQVLQRGVALSPDDEWRGPIRIGRPRREG
jgi:hypothetical protein